MGELDFRTVRELMALRARLRELMERATLPPTASPAAPYECPIDVWETDDEVVVEAELPGVAAEALELRLEGETLVIAGELTAPPEDGGAFLRVERYRGPFRRVVALPVEVGGAPRAALRRGVLEVRLPRRTPRRRRIAVASEAV